MVDTSMHRVVDMKTWTTEIGENDGFTEGSFQVQNFVFTDEDDNTLTVKCFLKKGNDTALRVLTEKD